jgi:CHRD domain
MLSPSPAGIAARIAAVTGLVALVGLVSAQTPDTFTTRLSWVPISGAERNDVSGRGSATATLSGSKLSITGTFENLPAPATLATLRQGVATGAHGPVIAELRVTSGADGTLSGEVALDDDERAALLAGELYVQLHAERGVPPDNAVLRGWLLAAAPAASPERRRTRKR